MFQNHADLIYYIQGKHLRDKVYRKPNLKVESLPKMVRNYRGSPRWLPGQITVKLGPLSYKAKVRGQTWKRHLDQLRLWHIPVTATENTDNDFFTKIPSSTLHEDSRPIPPVICGSPERRYPIRDNRQPPDRLTY